MLLSGIRMAFFQVKVTSPAPDDIDEPFRCEQERDCSYVYRNEAKRNFEMR